MRILLATDGSVYSAEAARQCGRILSGHINEPHVKVITVVDNFTPMATEPFITSQEFLENVEKQMREDAENNLLEAEEILRQHERVLDIETEILMGSAKKLIVSEAEKWKADLVVCGSHGAGFWARALLGTVSDAVVHHAPCSVLVVKKGARGGGGSSGSGPNVKKES